MKWIHFKWKGHVMWVDSVPESIWHCNIIYNCSISHNDVSFPSILTRVLHSVLEYIHIYFWLKCYRILLVCNKSLHVILEERNKFVLGKKSISFALMFVFYSGQ